MNKWNHVIFENCSEKITMDDIKKVEAALGVTFPKDFTECMLENNDGSPIPCAFDYGEVEGKVFNTFYSLSDAVGHYYILDAYNATKNYLPEGVIPIGYDAGGGDICFDYTNGKLSDPVVVYADHEFLISESDLDESDLQEKTLNEWQRQAISPLAASFSEFLAKLYNDTMKNS